MGDESEKIWDEYDWERFLQQQDRKTEHYMELLEKYMDDPNRDQIIAREMGWHHLLDDEGRDWIEDVDTQFTEEMQMLAEELEPASNDQDGEEEEYSGGFEMHPLYQTSFRLTVWLDHFFREFPELQDHPAAVRLASHSAIASSKLAAALSDDDIDEIGMTIAYLKRALKAITLAMEAAAQLHREAPFEHARYAALGQRLFQIRDGIIVLMGDFRSEWRARFGED